MTLHIGCWMSAQSGAAALPHLPTINRKPVFLGRKAEEKQEEKRSRGADTNASYQILPAMQ